MNYRWGFKSEAEEIATEIWPEIGNPWLSNLDLERVTDHLGIAVIPISELRLAAPTDVAYFSGQRSGQLSAFTAFEGPKRTIFFNDYVHPNRQRSSICHELGHALLLHEKTPPLTAEGVREFDGPIEYEADFLGAALLIPKQSAIAALRHDMSIAEIAITFQVSEQLARWRTNASGARKIVRRTRRKYGRPVTT